MKRHRKEEYMKKLNKLYDEKLNLFKEPEEEGGRGRRRRYQDTRMIWVPVEEPQHIGWEYTVVLSDAALRRRDSHRLTELLDLLRVSGTGFSRDLRTLKLVRSSGKRYQLVKQKWWASRKYAYMPDMPGGISYVEGATLSVENYERLSEGLKCYFTKYERWYPPFGLRPGYTLVYYKLSYKFPFHELRIKADKCYSTHRGIPKADEISRDQEIDNIFEREQYWKKRYGSYDGWSRYERKRRTGSVRKAYKAILNQVCATDDIEVYEALERHAVKYRHT